MLEPIQKMYRRLEFDRNDSENSHFDCLLIFFEMLIKLFILGVISGIRRDQQNTKESLLYDIIYSNSLGGWVNTFNRGMIGPAYNIMHWLDSEKREIVGKFGEDSWQHQLYMNISETLNILDSSSKKEDRYQKYNMIDCFQKIVTLRNRDAHGATPIVHYEKMVPLISKSIDLFIENTFLFKKQWLYIKSRLSNGRPFVYKLSNTITDAQSVLEEKENIKFDGIYILIEKNLYKIELVHFEPKSLQFFFPNGNYKNGLFEGLNYVNNERIELRDVRFLKSPKILEDSETKSTGNLGLLFNKTLSNIPIRSPIYIDRKDYEDKIYNILNIYETHPIIVISGRGGIGKTSLTLALLWKMAKEGNYNVIIWFSARDIDLSVKGAKKRRPDVLDVQDISKQYAELMGESTHSEKSMEFLKLNLQNPAFEKTLYVIDNFETVINMEETYNFFDEHIRTPNKLVITTRVNNNLPGAYNFEINGMDREQTFKLIDEIAANSNIEHKIDRKFKQNIFLKSQGHPYVIKILMYHFIKNGEIPNLNQSAESILNALFDRTYDKLSVSAETAFLTLCLWKSEIHRVIFESVLSHKMHDINASDAINELKNNSFIEIIGKGQDEIIKIPSESWYYGKQKLLTYPDKYEIEQCSEILKLFDDFSSRRTDIENKVKFFLDNSQNTVSLNEQIEIIKIIGNKYPDALFYLALYLNDRKENRLSKYYFEKYIQKTAFENTNAELLNLAWYWLYSVCIDLQDWRCALNSLIQRSKTPNIQYLSLSLIAYHINTLFKNHNQEFNINERERVSEVIEVLIKRENEANATDYSRIAWMYLNLHQKEKAKEMVLRGLSLDHQEYHCNRILERLTRT